MRIIYSLNSINYIGGIERVTIVKANALANIEGNEVFILVTDENGKYCTELSPKVNLINLNINYYKDDWKPGINAKISHIRKYFQHRTALHEQIKQIKPDVVISVGQSEKYFLIKNIFEKTNTLFIRELHFATNYRLLLARSSKSRMIARILNFFDFSIFSKFYDAVIGLTPEDIRDNWGRQKNIYFMPNPLTLNYSDFQTSQSNKKIVTVGRLSYQKNFASLINSFAKIASKYQDWTLEIYGEGPLRKELTNLINGYNLNQQIKLMGSTNNVNSAMRRADFFALSSRMEGFPLVLLEAMSNGLPVISFDLPYGPSYIIDNDKNGFLVPYNDEKELAHKMEILMNDRVLMEKMSIAAKEKAKLFLPEKIAKDWMELFAKLKNK